ncbi:hypothetical protein Kpol_1028p101 [Vanderwaltozyma polyspora DSM 70294]|uniref:PX domain-containing protein n=1 Tax=Vanderwaltozyma polyspora (strain ATCC 22028 / DSM 70294 / BCRC 21397 / CBS 2163 / NBRC 10782 / NRRL Y-8283 / UCD 57-17) TaxID=436907 RepID=A7TG68_VANPO|nr:uncharacterized protein Kpol_1028p101 [Vanderwaltozyma polyspora DSM 70294]EDO18825.1 hypothetical protein Kpol_1028p101 [Vanderwaltozyma polyspora DSM 70294]
MLSVFQNNKQRSGNELKRSISKPMKKEALSRTVSHEITLETKKNKYMTSRNYNPNLIKLYTVTKSFTPTEPFMYTNNRMCPFISVQKESIVQIISYEDNDMCYIRLVDQLGQGLVPVSHLKEDKDLNRMIPCPVARTNTLVNMTPPTSPSTLTSNTFSIGSSSRSTSASSSQRSSEDVSVQSCKLISVDIVEKRVQYTLNLRLANNGENIVHRYYGQFYKLHTKLLSIGSNYNEIKLPSLPHPLPFTGSLEHNSTLINDRVQEFNDYLANLLDNILNSSSIVLKDLINNWFIHGTVDVPSRPNIIKIKINYNGDCYASKAVENDVNNIYKLHNVICDKIKYHGNGNLVITAKVDGWYIIDLTNDEVYLNVLQKAQETHRLLLDVTIN